MQQMYLWKDFGTGKGSPEWIMAQIGKMGQKTGAKVVKGTKIAIEKTKHGIIKTEEFVKKESKIVSEKAKEIKKKIKRVEKE